MSPNVPCWVNQPADQDMPSHRVGSKGTTVIHLRRVIVTRRVFLNDESMSGPESKCRRGKGGAKSPVRGQRSCLPARKKAARHTHKIPYPFIHCRLSSELGFILNVLTTATSLTALFTPRITFREVDIGRCPERPPYIAVPDSRTRYPLASPSRAVDSHAD